MNGNRSKYTYTPTFGMQKKGLSRKSAPVRPAPEAPDFTQVPDPAIGVPLQQTMPAQGAAMPPQMDAYMPQPSYFNGPQTPPPAQIPFAAPNFVQSAQQNPFPQMQPAMQQNYQPPLVNSVQRPTDFSGRGQGFVPPQSISSPGQPVNAMPPQIGWNSPQTPQQSIPPFSGSSMAGGQQPPYQSMPQQPVYPPLQPMAQQPGFTIQATPVAKPPRAAAPDADKLWSVFLFGLLPLLFIPCLFATNAWDVLRYIFLGASVLGLGVMWFRQMYTSASRLVISVVYVALCIATMAMLMQGTNDARQTAANLAQPPQQAENTPVPAAAGYDPEAAPAAPTPAPTAVQPSEAERRLESFMDYWKVNNTTEMVNLVQPSWRGQQENAAASLFYSLANRTPEDFTIEDISGTETDNSRTITMRATINKNTGKPAVVYRFMVMMVKEGGEWYVNPNSLATNDAQQTTEDENVVKTQSSGAITEPPRETVTPAPPASTLLYYNNGGNNYHMDPECSKVSKDNLPFDNSFPYSELKNYNRTLLPCLNCNAPTDPLD